MFLILLAGIVVVGVALSIVYARWHYGTLESLGIPMVGKPSFWFGNTWDAYEKPAGIMDIERYKKFGPVYGVYEGRDPQIFICEAKLIKAIMVKDAESFNDKRRIDFRDPWLNEMPDFQPYAKWKAVRSFLTPAFSSFKMKQMSESMAVTFSNFTDNLKMEINKAPDKRLAKYDLATEYFSMITDMIARCCFSVQIENPGDPNNMFANIVRGLLVPTDSGPSYGPMLDVLSWSFPFLGRFAPPLLDLKKSYAFRDVLQEMIDRRRKSGEKKRDVVDICIEQLDKLDTEEYKKWNITVNTILMQGFVFFFAGQDQLSTISSCMMYYVLKNPSIEKRLYEEIDSYFQNHEEINYADINNFPYLNACLYETARLVPFFNRTERVCTKDWENEEFNLKIKKGMTVMIPIWAANRNPAYFPDPETFNPDRFLPENKEQLNPYSFTSFGHGPRNCIGQRFSMETMLMLSVFMLKRFKFHLRSDSKPEWIPGGPFFSPHSPFFFDVTLRT